MSTRPCSDSIFVFMRKPLVLRWRSSAVATSSLHAACAAGPAAINRAIAVSNRRIVCFSIILVLDTSLSTTLRVALAHFYQRRVRVILDLDLLRIVVRRLEDRLRVGSVA